MAVARRRVLAPLKGWASAKCLADAPVVLPPPPPEAGPQPPQRLGPSPAVHTDHSENLDWLKRVCARTDFRRDGLILAGDVSSRFSILREALQLCKRAFADVSFVPGNHDVWVTRGEPWADSLAKLDAVDALCDELGVRRTPAIMGGCVVAPLCAWHHAAFDREPDITGWAGLPPASQVISDFYLCKFPGCLRPMTRWPRPSTRATMMTPSPRCGRASLLPLVTFSHFVPRP